MTKGIYGVGCAVTARPVGVSPPWAHTGRFIVFGYIGIGTKSRGLEPSCPRAARRGCAMVDVKTLYRREKQP